MVVISYLESFADLDTGARVFYRCWKPQKPRITIVGIHGYTAHSGFYMHVGSALASYGFAVCMPDVRGHGRTTASESARGYVDPFNYFLMDLESFSKHVLKELGVERLVLLGHSMGGFSSALLRG